MRLDLMDWIKLPRPTEYAARTLFLLVLFAGKVTIS